MSLFALSLVLVAALLHAVWNVVAKKAGGDSRFVLLVALMIVVVWAPVGLWAGWDALPRWGWVVWALIVTSGMTNLVYSNVLLRGYAVQLAPLSHVAPAREVSMLFAALWGGKLLGEGDRGLRIVGAAFIALGVAGLALG